MPVRLHLLVDQGQKVARMHRMHSLRPERIRVVSTDSPGALYQAFSVNEGRRPPRGLEFHDVAKHASWLNMVEIKIGVSAAQCQRC